MSTSRKGWIMPGSFLVMLALYLIFPSRVSAASKDDDNEDLADKWSTDLAPLLALLGERVTMQFLSQATGWSDNITLSMLPLGILTIMVSAIRVGGPVWLKAVVGRARENVVTAELELMSSTSDEACELWNGQTLVRCQGSGSVWELICVFPRAANAARSEGTDTSPLVARVMTLNEAMEQGILQEREKEPIGLQARRILDKPLNTIRRSNACVMPNVRDIEMADLENDAPDAAPSSQSNPRGLQPNQIAVIRHIRNEAPNITLNTHVGCGRAKLRALSALGVLLQVAVVIYGALRTYLPDLSSLEDESSNKTESYAFPLAASGAFLLSVGVCLCCHVVDRSTIERTYEVVDKSPTGMSMRIFWLQKENKVSDQFFNSVAIHSKEPCSSVSISTRTVRAQKEERQSDSSLSPPQDAASDFARIQGQKVPLEMNSMGRLKAQTTVGAFLCLAGFIVQFMGQREMHWSVSLCNLAATLVMAILRATVRLDHLERLTTSPLESRFELDCLAETLVQYGETFNERPEEASQDSQLIFGKTSDEMSGSESWEESSKSFTVLTACGMNFTPGDDQSPTTIASASGMLILRRDLARLADWRGPAAAEAICLAKSIDLAMGAFCPLPHKGSGKLSWELKVQRGQVEPESIFIALDWSNGTWHTRVDDVESALSLWLHSASSHQQTGTGADLDSTKDDSWLRGQDPQRHPGLRILGPYTSSLLQDLKWWMPDGLGGLLRAEEDVDPSLLNQSQQLLVDQTHVANSGRRLARDDEMNKPTEAPTPKPSGKVMWKIAPAQGHEPTKSCDSEVAEDTARDSFLASRTHDPGEKLYAQDLFSAFMWTLAEGTDHTKGGLPTGLVGSATIEASRDNGLEGWKHFTLRSGPLTKLAQDIESTGLGSLGQIYQSMIPALSTYDKLPCLDAVADLARDHGRIQEHSRRWKEALESYEWLFQVARSYSPRNSIYRKALAILLSFQRRLKLHWQLGCGSDREPGPMGLNKEAKRVKKLIESADPSAVQALREWPMLSDRDSLMHLSAKNDTKVFHQDQLETRAPYLPRTNSPKREEPANILTRSNEDKEARDAFESRRLHYAASRHNGLFIELGKQPEPVLRLGAFPRSTNKTQQYQWTFRHAESAVASEACLDALLKDGADPNVRDLNDWTPLHYACLSPSSVDSVQEKVRLLLEKHARVDARGLDGIVPIHCAAVSGNTKTIQTLLLHGANINDTNTFGLTPLHLASLYGRTENVRCLVKRGADKIQRDLYGRFAAHCAARSGVAETLEIVMNTGEEAHDAWDVSGRSPLNHAIFYDRLQTVRHLLEFGPSSSLHDRDGKIPVNLATRKASHKVHKLVLRYTYGKR